MAEVTATCRTRQQGARLKALRERLGISKGALIDALSFGSTQTYDLYERGISIIRMDRIEDWAAAFGMEPDAFVAAVLRDDDEYDFLAELERVLPHDPDEVTRLYRKYEDATTQNQRFLVEHLEDRSSLDADAPQPTTKRAQTRQRAEKGA